MPKVSREIALSSNVLLENRSSAVAKRSTKSGGESVATNLNLKFQIIPVFLLICLDSENIEKLANFSDCLFLFRVSSELNEQKGILVFLTTTQKFRTVPKPTKAQTRPHSACRRHRQQVGNHLGEGRQDIAAPLPPQGYT